MKKFLVLALVSMSILSASAQVSSKVVSDKGEHWWGGFTALGGIMPFTKPTSQYDFRTQTLNNQTAPFFVSSRGRYIFSDAPFKWSFDGQNFLIDAPTAVEAVSAGTNLREAYVIAINKHFKPSGVMPPALFFEHAQFNTWIELIYDQNQAGIEAYADAILANGFKPGVLMIDDNWQRYYGNFDFKSEKFPDAKAMIDRLHKQGFKVMVWVSPFVSADSPEYRELKSKGLLVGGGRVTEWWNGWSAVYDLTNPDAMNYLQAKLKAAQEKYGIDGFKFDGGDVQFYDVITANDQTVAWQTLATKFAYNELRASWGASNGVQRLGDKDYSWGALRGLIPEMIAGSLLGFPYMCPDMIGGGQYGSFIGVDRDKLDQTLIVRWAQASAFMPMMQFSIAPWKVVDAQNMKYILAAEQLHEKISPYILSLAAESAKSGEPIVRNMEYNYPHQGFYDCLDQFMLGTKYLVAPILTKDGSRMVRLPKGRWVDDKGKRHVGPRVIEVTADLGRLPYFTLQ